MRRVSWRARLAAALMSVMTAAAVFGMSLTAMAATSTEAANVRSEASSDGNLLGVLYPGTQAAVLDEVTGDDGNTWYHIEFSLDGNTITGYVRGDLLTDIDAEVNLDAAEEAETEEAPQEETQEAAAEETTPEQMPEAQEAAAIGEDEPGEVTAVPVPEQVPADFNPMTDPSAQVEMRFMDNGDGTGSWVAYNDQPDKEVGLTDSSAAAPAPETVQAEISRMKEAGLLSEAEAAAVRPEDFCRFLESPLGRRMAAAGKTLRREQPFVLDVPARELFPDRETGGGSAEADPEKPGESAAYESGEPVTVLIQGTIDAYWEENGEFILVDYKTDRLQSPDGAELVGKYRKQLEYYARALAQITEIPVREMWIYSVYAGASRGYSAGDVPRL